jgi:hypothetical protein
MSDRIENLTTWWAEQAGEEIAKMGPKAVEYGAYDLTLVGAIMQDTMGLYRDVNLAELACWFYIFGKIGRVVGALRVGAAPSDDTILDIGIYSRMIQRIRQSGGWPDGETGPL